MYNGILYVVPPFIKLRDVCVIHNIIQVIESTFLKKHITSTRESKDYYKNQTDASLGVLYNVEQTK